MLKFFWSHRLRWKPSTPLKGGIMLSALGIILVVSGLFYMAIENRQLTANVAVRTQRAYRVRIMEEMFWHHYKRLPEEERPASGKIDFAEGYLEFGPAIDTNHKKFRVKVILDGRIHITYHSEIKNDPNPESK